MLNTHVLGDGPFCITVEVTSPVGSAVLEHSLEVTNGNGPSARYLKDRLSSLPAPFFAGPVSSDYFTLGCLAWYDSSGVAALKSTS